MRTTGLAVSLMILTAACAQPARAPTVIQGPLVDTPQQYYRGPRKPASTTTATVPPVPQTKPADTTAAAATDQPPTDSEQLDSIDRKLRKLRKSSDPTQLLPPSWDNPTEKP